MAEDKSVLFVRENNSENEDIWDDTALIQAYDRAVNLAKEEVAKRIAMDMQAQQTKHKSNVKHLNHIRKPLKKWTVGAPCRAVYSVDGEVYEAIISKIHPNSGMCTVKFVGYQNAEKVEINSLLESEGLQSQIAQQKDALAQKADEEIIDSDTSTHFNLQDSKQINSEKMDYDTEDPRSFKHNAMPGFEYFNPAIDAMPPAPPLPPLMAKLPETDADALSSMLMSWYLSGFHTGYYHGLKQAKNQQKRRNC
ncbi:PREDICTED: survival motor neuron protein isoform X1 [Acromyrmex echinatior]|uniref:Survival motor neuron protein n=2 Tax=Acromyrmex echinatior TaxID=103372 RepID=F4WXK1_ACREC|nr:PREDICTED: survival motor neuron protein isoform X1 [Acromyrmex echinatior]EGI61071.1 Survival motor neuron protein [Acromyrmex echinatior]